MAGGWRPWQELRQRPHLRLQWAAMHPSRGRIEERPDGTRLITLDPRLDRVTRNAVLCHELIHDELDYLFPPDTPECVVARAERIVEGETADRLVPPDELRLFVENLSEFEGVTSWQVSEKFEVPSDVAHLALLRLVAGF